MQAGVELPHSTVRRAASSLLAQDLFSLKGRKALVTGASRGIGAAIAEALALNGAAVGLNYSRRADEEAGFARAAEHLGERIRSAGGAAVLLEQDMAGHGAGGRVATAMRDELGAPDIVVICASVQVHGDFLDMTSEATLRQLQLNFVASVELLQAVLPGMKQRGYGRIVTIGSVQEIAPSPEMPVYAATKAAQANLVRNLAVQLAPHGVTINDLAPGLVETDRNAFRRRDPAEWASSVRVANPMGRAGMPEEIAGAALYLCSDAASFVTGATLYVTGGAHIPQVAASTASASAFTAIGGS